MNTSRQISILKGRRKGDQICSWVFCRRMNQTLNSFGHSLLACEIRHANMKAHSFSQRQNNGEWPALSLFCAFPRKSSRGGLRPAPVSISMLQSEQMSKWKVSHRNARSHETAADLAAPRPHGERRNRPDIGPRFFVACEAVPRRNGQDDSQRTKHLDEKATRSICD